jgi:hypothetical protein
LVGEADSEKEIEMLILILCFILYLVVGMVLAKITANDDIAWAIATTFSWPIVGVVSVMLAFFDWLAKPMRREDK